jgi:hypothetical protein
LRFQRSVLFQPLLSPPLWADALGGAGAIKRNEQHLNVVPAKAGTHIPCRS